MVQRVVEIKLAAPSDLCDVLSVQREAFGRVATELNIARDDLPPLLESRDDLARLQREGTRFLIAVEDAKVVGSIRAHEDAGRVELGRLVVSAVYQRQGIGTRLIQAAEALYPAASAFELFTGEDARAALLLYEGLGYYRSRGEMINGVRLVWLEKKNGTL